MEPIKNSSELTVPEYVEYKMKKDPSFNCHLFYEQFHIQGSSTGVFYKLKGGWSFEEVLQYGPEFANSFPTQLIAIHKSKSEYKSLQPCLSPNQFMFKQFPQFEKPILKYFQTNDLSLDEYSLNFVHPWQWNENSKIFKTEINQNLIVVIPSYISESVQFQALISTRSLAFSGKEIS
eukprot:gene4330-5420_t